VFVNGDPTIFICKHNKQDSTLEIGQFLLSYLVLLLSMHYIRYGRVTRWCVCGYSHDNSDMCIRTFEDMRRIWEGGDQKLLQMVILCLDYFNASSRAEAILRILGSTQPHIQRVPGTFSPEVKRPGREAGHSPPASVGVKKLRIYTSTSPYAFMA
jgi:hypothetical protein